MKASAYLKIILAMTIWGTLGIFVRKVGIPSSEIVLFRIVIGAVFLSAVLLMRRRRTNRNALKKYFFVLMLSGVCMGFNWLFLFEAYRYTTVSMATVIYYCAPIIVTLLSPLVLKEKISSPKLMGIFCSMIGLVLISGISAYSNIGTKGLLCGFAAAFLYAMVTILNKFVKGLNGVEITLVQLFGAFVVMLLYCIITLGKNFALPQGSEAIISMIVLGVLHTGAALFLYFSSLQSLSAQSAALCSYIDPASAIIFSAIILNERMSFIQTVGAVLILGGAFLGELLAPHHRGRRRG